MGTLPAIHRPCRENLTLMHHYNSAARLGCSFSQQTSEETTLEIRSIHTEPGKPQWPRRKMPACLILNVHTPSNHSHHDPANRQLCQRFPLIDTRKPGLEISDSYMHICPSFVQSSLTLKPKQERCVRQHPSMAALEATSELCAARCSSPGPSPKQP